MSLFRTLGLVRRFDEGRHPRDAKGRFAPKGAGSAAGGGGTGGGGVPDMPNSTAKMRTAASRVSDAGWGNLQWDDGDQVLTAETGERMSLMLSFGDGYTSIMDTELDVEMQIDGIRIPKASQALGMLKREYPEEYE